MKLNSTEITHLLIPVYTISSETDQFEDADHVNEFSLIINNDLTKLDKM